MTRVPLLLLFVSNFLYRDPTRHTFVLNQALAHLEMSFITISTHSSSMLMPIRVRPFLFVLEMHRRLILEQPTLCVESNEPTQWKRLHLSTANFIRYLMVLVKVQARTGYAVIERRTAIARGNQLGSFTWERNNTMKRIMRLLGKPTTCNNSNMAFPSYWCQLDNQAENSSCLDIFTTFQAISPSSQRRIASYCVSLPPKNVGSGAKRSFCSR